MPKKALVISGGGSKGAFAGGVAKFLIEDKKNDYEIIIGTSTGSLMVTHLALKKLDELREIYSNIKQRSIFSNNPFYVRKVDGAQVVGVRHLNTLWNFMNGRKTFGESKNLRKFIKRKITKDYFEEVKQSKTDVVVTVSNLTANRVEYKAVKDCTYDDFCDWIWGSCNYVPFMSLLKKNGFEYADGGFGALVPITEAINRGATEIDVIILETETEHLSRLPSTSPFSLLSTVVEFMLDQVEQQNVTIGKLEAKKNNVQLNLYYTPTVLTTNSLVFNKKQMAKWWEQGYVYAKNKELNLSNELK
ncbi:MAG: patatin-like phospholipase family protein [Flavobacteriaceae bacterium]|nr:patatin-like phospholipase family protein [Flavobacteriaceae bacterium]